MRIPSQFTEDNLYRRGSKRPKSSDSVRQIIRMVVVLVLLLVVMKQAGQPRIYEVFFGEEAETDTPTGELGDAFDAALIATQQHRVRDLTTDEFTRQVANALTRSMSLNEQRQWTAILSRWNSGKPFHLLGAVVEQTRSLLEDLTDVDDDQRAAWLSTLTAFGDIYVDSELVVGGEQSGEQPSDESSQADAGNDTESTGVPITETLLTDEDALRLVVWLTALDRAALDRVVDGSVWRSSDFDAFYLQLSAANTLESEGAVATAVVPLLQQPEVYRGQLVRVSGLIAKAERMDATANPHSIDQYWQLWIKPDTGSDRPMVVVVPNLTPSMTEVVQAGGHPRARFVGRFFKRLAYRSQVGADLAPVVIGRVSTPARASTATIAPSARGKTMSDGRRFLLTAIVASVIGVTIAGIAMWRSSVSGRRHRELRARRQQPEFPSSFDQLDATSESEQNHE